MEPTLAVVETMLRAFGGWLGPDMVDDFTERGRLVLASQLFQLRDCLRALEFGVQPGGADEAFEVLRFLFRPRFRDAEDFMRRQFPDCDWADAICVSSLESPSDKASLKGRSALSAASLARFRFSASCFLRASTASSTSWA